MLNQVILVLCGKPCHIILVSFLLLFHLAYAASFTCKITSSDSGSLMKILMKSWVIPATRFLRFTSFYYNRIQGISGKKVQLLVWFICINNRKKIFSLSLKRKENFIPRCNIKSISVERIHRSERLLDIARVLYILFCNKNFEPS